jgi:hypothetical protein
MVKLIGRLSVCALKEHKNLGYLRSSVMGAEVSRQAATTHYKAKTRSKSE